MSETKSKWRKNRGKFPDRLLVRKLLLYPLARRLVTLCHIVVIAFLGQLTCAISRADETLVLRTQQRHLQSVSFSPNGQHLLAQGLRSTVVWDLNSKKPILRIPGTICGKFSADGKTVIVGQRRQRMLEFWDMATRKRINKKSIYMGKLSDGVFALSRDERILAVWHLDRTVEVQDIKRFKDLATISKHNTAVVTAMAFSPNGKWFATGDNKSSPVIWDCANWKVKHTLNGIRRRINSLVFSPNNSMLACGSSDNQVSIWDVQSGKQIQRIPGKLGGQGAGLAFSTDNNLLAVATGNGPEWVLLWNVAERKPDAKLLPTRKVLDKTRFLCVDISRDGRFVAAGTLEQDRNEKTAVWCIRMWRVR